MWSCSPCSLEADTVSYDASWRFSGHQRSLGALSGTAQDHPGGRTGCWKENSLVYASSWTWPCPNLNENKDGRMDGWTAILEIIPSCNFFFFFSWDEFVFKTMDVQDKPNKLHFLFAQCVTVFPVSFSFRAFFNWSKAHSPLVPSVFLQSIKCLFGIELCIKCCGDASGHSPAVFDRITLLLTDVSQGGSKTGNNKQQQMSPN